MIKYIIIEVDTNDGDYITSKNEITDEDIELLKPILEIIKSKDGVYRTGEMGSPRNTYSKIELSNKQIKLLGDYIPYGEHGFHTITRVYVIAVIGEVHLL